MVEAIFRKPAPCFGKCKMCASCRANSKVWPPECPDNPCWGKNEENEWEGDVWNQKLVQLINASDVQLTLLKSARTADNVSLWVHCVWRVSMLFVLENRQFCVTPTKTEVEDALCWICFCVVAGMTSLGHRVGVWCDLLRSFQSQFLTKLIKGDKEWIDHACNAQHFLQNSLIRVASSMSLNTELSLFWLGGKHWKPILWCVVWFHKEGPDLGLKVPSRSHLGKRMAL